MNYRLSYRIVPTVLAAAILFACASGGNHSSAAPSSPTAAAAAVTPQAPNANGASIQASQDELFPIKTPEEKKRLFSEFKKTLNSEEKNFQKQDKASLKDLATSQTAKQKDWRAQEKKARELYFEQHQSGPDRRQYVQDYLKRKTAYDQAQKDELASAKKTSKERAEKLKTNQASREAQFKSQLDQNQRPDSKLWKLDL